MIIDQSVITEIKPVSLRQKIKCGATFLWEVLNAMPYSYSNRSHNIPVSVEKILLDDVFVKTRFVHESVLQPGSLVAESDKEHGPRGEVTVV